MARTNEDREKDVATIIKGFKLENKEWFEQLGVGSLEKAIEEIYNIYKFSCSNNKDDLIFDELLEYLAILSTEKINRGKVKKNV